MQIDAPLHFEVIVSPSIRAYLDAEEGLTVAVTGAADEGARMQARFNALRQGGAAALYLHHFADIIAHRPPASMAEVGGDVSAVRAWLTKFSIERTGRSDVELLGHVADALKHSVLTRKLPREVEEAGQVLITDRGYGTGRFGEGKFGGAEEVWILGRSGRRSLTAVLTSVSTAWALSLFG